MLVRMITLLFLSLTFFSARAALATVIVVVRTAAGFWVGADGVRSDDGRFLGSVCKIHQMHGWLLLKSGASQGYDRAGNDYSIDAEIRNYAQSAETVEKFKDSVSLKLPDEIREEVYYLVRSQGWPLASEHPLIDSFPFQEPVLESWRNGRTRMITLIGLRSNVLTNISFSVHLSTFRAGFDLANTHYNPLFPYRIKEDVADWVTTPFFSRSIAVLSSPGPLPYARDDAWITANPLKAIREILDIGHKLYPQGVGAPYSIVYVAANKKVKQNASTFDGSRTDLKITWIEAGACPGWTTTIDPSPTAP